MISRADTGVSGEVDGGSRNSLEGSARLGIAAAGGVLSLRARVGGATALFQLPEATRGPADERAPYREYNGRVRWVAPVGGRPNCRPASTGSTTGALGGRISRSTEPMARTPR